MIIKRSILLTTLLISTFSINSRYLDVSIFHQYINNNNYEKVLETIEIANQLSINIINEKDKEGQTSLHVAANNNNVRIAQLLLSRGANVNETDNIGRTALHTAVKNNDTQLTYFLLVAKTNTKIKTIENKTVLDFVDLNIKNYDTKILYLLLKHGAPVDLLNIQHQNMMIKVVEYIANNPFTPDLKSNQRYQQILGAILCEKDSSVQLLLESSTQEDLEIKDITGMTLSMWAAARGNFKIINAFTEHAKRNSNKEDNKTNSKESSSETSRNASQVVLEKNKEEDKENK